MPKKNKNIIMSRIEWLSMQYRPKKMKCDNDTAKQLIKVFGHSIVKDLEIILNKKEKKKDE